MRPCGRRRKARWWLQGIVLLAAGLLLVSDTHAAKTRAVTDRIGLEEGFRPPEFSATDLAGAPHSLQQQTGSVLVLHFWASWCPYCRAEIPELTRLQQDGGARGVKVLAVSVDEDLRALKRFLAQANLPYPVIADLQADPSLAEQYGISGIPVTFVISRDGHIAARLDGDSDIAPAVERALRQPSAT